MEATSLVARCCGYAVRCTGASLESRSIEGRSKSRALGKRIVQRVCCCSFSKGTVDRVGGRVLVWERQVVGFGLTGG